MPGVLIYQTPSRCCYSFVIADDDLYNAEIKEIPKRRDKILWEKGNVSFEQIEKSRKTKNCLVARLNNGEKVDLEKELDIFFI
ncbi:MAG TPA: hypothetical protein PK357_02480 [Candidatus Pacearchaeota archaeon]|nr:hypothetical protein [Candidatus Pacearchaeota archaeon]